MADQSRTIESSRPATDPARASRAPATRRTRSAPSVLLEATLNLAGEDRQRLIAEAAYFRAERRGFQPGRDLEDWLAAEIEIDALLGDDDGRA